MVKNSKQIVLITGASKGIGLVTANYLEMKGYRVYGTSRSSPDSFEEFDFSFLQLDITDDDSVSNCVNELIEREGRIDALVNNAGYSLVGPISDTSIDDIKRQYDTNFFGAHRMILEVLPIMKKQQFGRIINVGSFGGRIGLPFQSFYSASKSSLAVFTDSLRIELYTSGIKLSLIEPGDVNTGNHDHHVINAQNFNPENNEVARRALEVMRQDELKGISPEKVAKTIHKAIKSKRPKPRYLVGFQAKFFGTLQRFLPYTLQERINFMYYKVPRKS